MSIASEISRLQQAKSDLATSITNKGVTVPAATTLDGYAALVDQIQTGGGLPQGAVEIEYLQSSGTQYINTGIPLNGYIRIISDSQMLEVNVSAALFGVFLSNTRFGVRFNKSANNNNKLYLYYGSSSTYNEYLCTDYKGDSFYLNRCTYDYANNVSIAGNTHTKGAGTGLVSFSSSQPIYSWACNANELDAGAFAPCKARKWYEKIYINGTLVRDYIPVRVGTVGYMYDKVSGELFGNAGTGSFILGNDIT